MDKGADVAERFDGGHAGDQRDGREDRDRAVALLREALSFASEAGMGKVQRDAERLLAEASA